MTQPQPAASIREPTGLYALVVAADGDLWLRTLPDRWAWRRVHPRRDALPEWANWADIAEDARILWEGVPRPRDHAIRRPPQKHQADG